MSVAVRRLKEHNGETVTVRGWLAGRHQSGEIARLEIRDGSGTTRAAVAQSEVSEEAWQAILDVARESTVRVTGVARLDESAPGGVEIETTDFSIQHLAKGYPLPPEESDREGGGPKISLRSRHLELRSKRRRTILAVRSEVCQAVRDFYYARDFTLIDAPVLTSAAQGHTAKRLEALGELEGVYLSPSGQLYLEPACAAFGKVYCLGPTFRAGSSRTPEDPIELWRAEAEVAFLDFDGLLRLAEELITHLATRVLDRCRQELEILGRGPLRIEKLVPSLSQVTHAEAIEILQGKGLDVEGSTVLDATYQTIVAEHFEGPVFLTRPPIDASPFFTQPDPENREVALSADLLVPGGYGEVLGGSQRIHDLDLLTRRLEEHRLSPEGLEWYLDVRKFGTSPHSGLGLGIEPFVAWITGASHLHETIPYPRIRAEIYP